MPTDPSPVNVAAGRLANGLQGSGPDEHLHKCRMRRWWSSVLNCQAKIPSHKTKSSAEGEVERIGELRGAKGCVDIRITYERSGPADGGVVLQSHIVIFAYALRDSSRNSGLASRSVRRRANDFQRKGIRAPGLCANRRIPVAGVVGCIIEVRFARGRIANAIAFRKASVRNNSIF